MDRIIEKLDHGWWVVSHEQKLWLPKGELPYGEAANFDLVGQRALQIGEWQGEPVWLVQQQRRHDMGSVRQVIDLDVGLFQLAGRGVCNQVNHLIPTRVLVKGGEITCKILK